MKSLVYKAGRVFQVAALIALPFAIWVGQIGHSERGAITIFVGSILVFGVGYCLTRLSARL